MRKEFADYLASISVPTSVVGRVDRIIALYADLMPATDPEKIFVSDQFDQEGNRSFRSLFLFSDEYMLEAKSFVSEDNIDTVGIRRFPRLIFLKTDFDVIDSCLQVQIWHQQFLANDPKVIAVFFPLLAGQNRTLMKYSL